MQVQVRNPVHSYQADEEAARERQERYEREQELQDGYRGVEHARQNRAHQLAEEQWAAGQARRVLQAQTVQQARIAQQAVDQQAQINQQARRAQIAIQVQQGITNTVSGEFLAPVGGGFVGTRDGRLYVPAGPNGIIDTRTGQYIPAY